MFDVDELSSRTTVLLKPEFANQYNIVYPMWGSSANIFRVLPGRLQNGDLVDSVAYNGKCGPWLYPVYGITISSPTRQKTIIIGDRTMFDEYSIQNTLAYRVYKTIYDVVASGAKPAWEHYNLVRLRGSAFDPLNKPVLRRPGVLYLAFAEVVEHSRKSEIDPNKLSVLVLQQTAGQALAQAARMAYGYGKDIIKSTDGALVNIRPSQVIDPQRVVLCTERSNVGFAVDVLREPPTAPVEPEKLQVIRPWKDILEFASDEEQKRTFKELLPREVSAYLFNEPIDQNEADNGLPSFDDIPFDVPADDGQPNEADKPDNDISEIRDMLRKALEDFSTDK